MSITPEYAEEVLVEQREAEEAEAASQGLPPGEDLTEDEVAEARQAEEETHH